MNEQELLLDCLRRLNQGGVRYMLTGSMASNAWGIPRTTHDLDFVLQLPPSQVDRFCALFRSDDYFVDAIAVRNAYQPPYQFNVLHIASGLKIDFWMLRPLPFEREMFGRRVRDQWLETPVELATAEDVLLHKLLWNRMTPSDRQTGDVAGIVAVQGGRLDHAYLRRWANELGLSDDLEKALSGGFRPKST
jgi:hypothetical protein